MVEKQLGEILKITSENVSLKIMLLYRKNDCPLNTFYEMIHEVNLYYEVDIIAGDFNVKPNGQLNAIFQLYDQCVLEPTHLSGAVLDHVYVKKCLRLHYNVIVSVKRIFFSDHEAINIVLERKDACSV